MATPNKTPKPEQEPITSTPDAALTVEQMHAYMTEVHMHLDQVALPVREIYTILLDGKPLTTETLPLPKVQRRRSQDEMRLALRRLLSPDPRPRDDDSPQVVEDCFAEVIVSRQIIQELMQTMTSGYQHGLAAIRNMTNQ